METEWITLRLLFFLPIAEWFRLSYELAETYIRGNLNQDAIAVLDGISERIAALPSEPRKMIEAGLDRLCGLAWLRFAEQENCVSHHVAQSCLFPIRNAGVHRFRLASRRIPFHLALRSVNSSISPTLPEWMFMDFRAAES